ncbi:MAG: hypothetical protein BWK80_26270 [Desulfobacteraceae bacterium IS3]|nr:MAG: hypothetical protein BWK80_26270 [Desulfobacteraceae bacterium IS3]
MKTRNSEKWSWRISIAGLIVLAGIWAFFSRLKVRDNTNIPRHFAVFSGCSEHEIQIIIAVSAVSTIALMLSAALVFFNFRLRKAKKILEAEICDLRRIEEAKQESETRYRHIFEYSPLGIMHFDENGIINDCNAVFAEIIGAPRDRLIGFNMLKTMEDSPARSAIRDALEYGTGHFEGAYRTVSGNKEIFIRAVHKKITRPAGKFSGAIGIFEDITERRSAENALHESLARMNNILESISDGFFTLDNLTVVTYFNKAASRLLNRSAEEVLGHPLFETFPEAAGSVFEEKFTWAIKEKKPLVFETFFGVKPYKNWYDVRVYPHKDGISVYFQITTERKESEVLLKENEARYRSLFEDSPISLWEEDFSALREYIHDLRNSGITDIRYFLQSHPEALLNCARYVKIIDVNQNTLRLFKAAGKAELYYGLHNIFTDESLDIFREELAAFAEGRTCFASEAVQQTLTGEKIWTFVNASVAPGYEENWAKVFVSVIDISEQKLAEEQIRKSEERFRAIADYTYDWENWVNPDGKLIWTNAGSKRITGYSPEEYLSLPDRFRHTVFEEDLERVRYLFEKGLKERIHCDDLEFRIRRKDGDIRWVSVCYQPIYGTSGDYLGLRSSIRDISDRKQAEEELRKTRNYLSNILDSSPSAIIGIDRQGRVTAFNIAAEKLAGVRVQDARGKYLADVLPAYSEYLEDMKKVIRDRKPLSKEKILKQHSDQIYNDIFIYPLIANGVDGAVMRIDNVTARVQLEAMMIQTEKMTSVGGLAAGMAHEINNPLGAILSSVQNALRRLSPELEANIGIAKSCGTELSLIRDYLEKRSIFKYLEGIQNDGRRCAKIINDMLNFSRCNDSRQMILSDIHLLLDDTVSLAANDYDLKRKYDFRHIRIIRNYQDGLLSVPCMISEFRQVIFNLLKNAAQAMSEIRQPGYQPVIELKTMKSGSDAVIIISDNGPGMEESIRKRIFEPFFTTKDIGVGTGLGLSVSYFIITNIHKGEICAESEPGKGARFVIRLPLKQR